MKEAPTEAAMLGGSVAFVGFLLPVVILIGQVCALLAIVFVLAVRGDWRLVLIVSLGFAVGLVPFVLRPPAVPTAFAAILSLALFLILAGVYGSASRWVAATICLLSAALLIHGAFLPLSLRPVALEALQKFGIMVVFCAPITAALLAKEIALRFRPLPKSN